MQQSVLAFSSHSGGGGGGGSAATATVALPFTPRAQTAYAAHEVLEAWPQSVLAGHAPTTAVMHAANRTSVSPLNPGRNAPPDIIMVLNPDMQPVAAWQAAYWLGQIVWYEAICCCGAALDHSPTRASAHTSRRRRSIAPYAVGSATTRQRCRLSLVRGRGRRDPPKGCARCRYDARAGVSTRQR
jgi:hypothetical protein